MNYTQHLCDRYTKPELQKVCLGLYLQTGGTKRDIAKRVSRRLQTGGNRGGNGENNTNQASNSNSARPLGPSSPQPGSSPTNEKGIFVKTFSTTYTIPISLGATVLDLKAKIEEILDFHPRIATQTLSFQQQPLENDKTLTYYDIEFEDSVMLVITGPPPFRGECTATLTGHASGVNALAFDDGDNTLFSGDGMYNSGTIKVWK
jgi:WD40 repeat protein